jgi:hypothetical protein
MREICISPTDLMNYENSSYTIEFTRTFQNKEIVVFVLGEFFEPSLQKQQIIPRCIYSKELVSDLHS